MTTARLPSGITVDEAVARARKWWGEFRGMVRQEFTTIDETRKRVSRTQSGGLLTIIRDAFPDPQVRSGILRGLPWDQLTQQEQLEIVKQWHNHHLLGGQDDGRLIVDPDSARQVH